MYSIKERKIYPAEINSHFSSVCVQNTYLIYRTNDDNDGGRHFKVVPAPMCGVQMCHRAEFKTNKIETP